MPGSLETRLRTSSLSVRMWHTPLSTCHLKTGCQALWLLFAHTCTADKLGRLAGMTESSSCRPHACSHTYPLQLCVNTVTGPQPHTWSSLPPPFPFFSQICFQALVDRNQKECMQGFYTWCGVTMTSYPTDANVQNTCLLSYCEWEVWVWDQFGPHNSAIPPDITWGLMKCLFHSHALSSRRYISLIPRPSHAIMEMRIKSSKAIWMQDSFPDHTSWSWNQTLPRVSEHTAGHYHPYGLLVTIWEPGSRGWGYCIPSLLQHPHPIQPQTDNMW